MSLIKPVFSHRRRVVEKHHIRVGVTDFRVGDADAVIHSGVTMNKDGDLDIAYRVRNVTSDGPQLRRAIAIRFEPNGVRRLARSVSRGQWEGLQGRGESRLLALMLALGARFFCRMMF